jgi:hypothetical protein
MSLEPTRFMCIRGDYNSDHGDWEHRLVVETPQGEAVKYGPFFDVLKHMVGPRVSFATSQ